METFSLIVVFTLTGMTYTEREGLTLQGCAGRAAMARQEMLSVLPKLNSRIGEVRYLCIPERVVIAGGR